VPAVAHDTHPTPDDPFPSWIRTDRPRFEPAKDVSGTTLRDLFAGAERAFEHVPTAPVDALDDALSLVAGARDWWTAGDEASYLLRRRDDGVPVGTAGLEDVELDRRRASTGALLPPERWRRGYGRERRHALYAVGVDLPGLDVVRSLVVENDRSRAATRAAAGAVGGECRETIPNRLAVDGAPRDVVQYAVEPEAHETWRRERNA
jgi:RimJ/RimL family protein N-acetyltransferase